MVKKSTRFVRKTRTGWAQYKQTNEADSDVSRADPSDP